MKSKQLIKHYFKGLHGVAAQGDAREESFYPCLKDLLEMVAAAAGRSEVHVTVLPKPTEAGNPDFRVWNGRDQITGYIEAKAPTEEHLDVVETTEQLKRYRDTFPNLILTNFFEFRLYRKGRQVDQVVAARPRILTDVGAVPPVEKGDELLGLLERFFSFSMPRVFTAESLAVELAKRTRFFRDLTIQELKQEEENGRGVLLGFYQAFQKYLIGTLSVEDFADLYAQTITYGLFAARTRSGNEFSRRTAYDHIPRTIGILRDVFRFISLEDPPKQIEWIVDDIAHCLAVSNVPQMLHRYYTDGKGSDPIVYFYEPFLAEYDPGKRKRLGVYYTPEGVVSYIVRSLHELLKTQFNRADGLASDGVTLLDPAAGTMTFVAMACQEAVREFEGKYGSGATEEFIRGHLMKNFYAFELMVAAYAVGHLKISFFLEELGHRLAEDERFQFYLTNTLEMEELEQTQLPGMASLAEESRMAGEVKKERPILVILGNPPYSGQSANPSYRFVDVAEGKPYLAGWAVGEKGTPDCDERIAKRRLRNRRQPTFIGRLLLDYYVCDGNKLDERNPKWLQNDYVKFLRFAQWKIEQTGQGLVGMITDHSYLDNSTFRGMRQSLMRTFDEMYVLDLHGDSRKRERCPDGSKDENVFDIQQGVAIGIFVKRGQAPQAEATVHHADVWGLRGPKYDWLREHHVENTTWQQIYPRSPWYLFVPREEAALDRYNEFSPVTEIFPVHSVGIVTSRDRFVIDFDRRALERRIRQFLDPSMPDDIVREAFKLKDNRDWKMAEKRNLIRQDQAWEDKIVHCLYRPFDTRWLFYHYHAIDFGREEVMSHMLAGENIGVIIPRRVELPGGWQHALATDLPVEHVAVSLKTIDYFFPLYLYPDASKDTLFEHAEALGRREPNLADEVAAALMRCYGRQLAPEDTFHYVYAVLYAPAYREKYSELLKIDFARIPFTTDPQLFKDLGALGKRLADLHLLRSPELDPPAARFEGEGDNRVARTKTKGFRYEPKEERVYINRKQYFAPVPLELWQYQIGGYQVLHKWLKDRKDRPLKAEDIKTYCRVVTAIQRTIAVQEEIDALYPDAESRIVEL